MTLLKARQAPQYLRVSLFTLGKIEREGGLVPFRTPGGHCRYSLRMLHDYLENGLDSRNPKGSKLPRSKLRGIPSGMIVSGAAAPKPPLAIPPPSKLGGILATLVTSGANKRWLVLGIAIDHDRS